MYHGCDSTTLEQDGCYRVVWFCDALYCQRTAFRGNPDGIASGKEAEQVDRVDQSAHETTTAQ